MDLLRIYLLRRSTAAEGVKVPPSAERLCGSQRARSHRSEPRPYTLSSSVYAFHPDTTSTLYPQRTPALYGVALTLPGGRSSLELGSSWGRAHPPPGQSHAPVRRMPFALLLLPFLRHPLGTCLPLSPFRRRWRPTLTRPVDGHVNLASLPKRTCKTNPRVAVASPWQSIQAWRLP